MRRTYHQLTIEERCEMARLQGEGYSQCQIAASLDRSPSTVSRELRRNSSRTGGYKPTYANQQARARRWSGSKLDRDAGLRRQVLSCLMRGLVAGASVGSSGAGGGRQGHLTRDHLPLHLCPDDAHEELLLAPLSAQGQVQARSASARAQKPCLVHTTAPCAGPAARGGRRPRHPRSLGGRPDALRQTGASRC